MLKKNQGSISQGIYGISVSDSTVSQITDRYMFYKDLKRLVVDLKAVYAAVDEQAALDALDTFRERWHKKYPKISQSWRSNWAISAPISSAPGGAQAALHHQRH